MFFELTKARDKLSGIKKIDVIFSDPFRDLDRVTSLCIPVRSITDSLFIENCLGRSDSMPIPFVSRIYYYNYERESIRIQMHDCPK